jgi:CAAX protease family protein
MDNLSSSRIVVPSSSSLLWVMRHHPLVCYFLMAYGFSWLGWLPYVLSQSGLGLFPFHLSEYFGLPGAYLGPLLSGFLMTAVTEGKTGVRHLLRRFVLWRVGWQWYLFALIGGPAIMVLGTLTLPGAVGALHLPSLQLVLVFLPVLVLEIFTSGLSEEPGWRGFALPRLQQQHGPLLGTLILGLLWACWHLPLFLTAWQVVGTDLLTICEFVLGTMSLAIVITWVFNHTQGSLLLAILLHAALDTFGSVGWTSFFPAPTLLKSAYLGLLIGFGVVALLLMGVTRGCLGYQRALPFPDAEPILDGGKP